MSKYIMGTLTVEPRIREGTVYYEVHHHGACVMASLSKLKMMIQDAREAEEIRAREEALICPELEEMGFTLLPVGIS